MASSKWIAPAATVPEVRRVSTLGAFVLLAIAVGINNFASGHGIGDRVYGAIVLYLPLGLIWAVTCQLGDSVSPGSFARRAGGSAELVEWVHFKTPAGRWASSRRTYQRIVSTATTDTATHSLRADEPAV